VDNQNLSEIVDSDEDIEIAEDPLPNVDAMSNESQGAESKRNSLSPRHREEE